MKLDFVSGAKCSRKRGPRLFGKTSGRWSKSEIDNKRRAQFRSMAKSYQRPKCEKKSADTLSLRSQAILNIKVDPLHHIKATPLTFTAASPSAPEGVIVCTPPARTDTSYLLRNLPCLVFQKALQPIGQFSLGEGYLSQIMLT